MIEDSAAKAMSWKAPEVVAAEQAAPAAAAAAEEAPGRFAVLKNMLLFLSAPFVGLVYAVLLPFVGMFMLARIGGKALMQQPAARAALSYTKFVLKMVAAPFVGLAYILAFPFVGLAMLIWNGGKALIGARTSE
jgi:hypothetical protein